MKYILKASAMSLAAVAVLSMSGCSSSDSNGGGAVEEDTTTTDTTAIEEVSSIGGTAVDGYLRYATVCLDISGDSFCQPTEPFTLTDIDGAFTLQLTDEQKSDPNYAKAQLIVYGGQDSDRPGEDFIGKLKAPNDGTGSVSVTPVTTLVSAYIAQSTSGDVTQEDIDAATAKVAEVLNLTVEQVLADPRATNDEELMNATLQLQYAVNAMVQAAESTNTADVAGNIYDALASGLDDATAGESVADGVSSILDNADEQALNDIDANLVKVIEVAKVAATNVNTVMTVENFDMSDTTALNDALTKVVVLQDMVIAELETADLDNLTVSDFDYTDDIDGINFDDEAAKIYLTDLGVDIEADGFDLSLYSGELTLDMDLEELQTTFADSDIIDEIDAEIASVDEEIASIISEVADAVASADADEKMAALEGDITELFETTKVATVDDAKNTIAQIRESVYSFVDIDNENVEDNTSTILGSQVSMITDKIQPAVEAIANDFNSSFSALESSVKAFGDSLEPNFAAVLGSYDADTDTSTIGSIEARINAIDDAIFAEVGADDETTDWSITAGDDTLAHTYVKDGDTVTETFTFNGKTITTSWEDVEDGDLNSITTSGEILFAGTGYDLKISSFDFSNNKFVATASGTITGADGSSMTLSAMDIAFDIDEEYMDVSLHMFANIEATLTGTIVSSGRTLAGSLVMSESVSANNKMIGSYTGAAGEPSFDGALTLDASLDDVKTLIDDDSSWNVNPNSLLMVTYDNGDKSFVESYSQITYNYPVGTFALYTQDGNSLSCDVTTTSDWNSYSQEVDCTDGSVEAYYGDDKVITLTVNGSEYQVDDAWNNSNWDGTQEVNAVEIDLKNGYIGYHNGSLYIDVDGDGAGSVEATISDISIRDAYQVADMDAKYSFVGTYTDGSKKITASIGLTQDSSKTTLFAENMAIEDGTSFIRLGSLSVTSTTGMLEDDNVEHSQSLFEDYSYDYNSYDDQENDFASDFAYIAVDDLNVSITDSDSEVLTFDADMVLAQTDLGDFTATFNGFYSYAGTTFTGVIDASGNDDAQTLAYSVYGSVGADGFEPFTIAVAGSMIQDDISTYFLFSRGTDYKLGATLNTSYDEDSYTTTIVYELADSNGVMSEIILEDQDLHVSSTSDDGVTCYVHIGDDHDNEVEMLCSEVEGSDESIILTDKEGTQLAEMGADATGNSWEVVYSDNSSETLF